MLSLTGYRLVLWTGAIHIRQGFNGLSGIVCNHIKEDPFKGGTIYAFFNQRRTQVKLLLWEGDGLAIYYKRLSKGSFGTPYSKPPSATALTLIISGDYWT